MKKLVIPTLLLVFWTPALASLSGDAVRACLEKDFEVRTSHKTFPFGVFSRKLIIIKSKCEIRIKYNSYHWIKKQWIIDVCREPIHIKSGVYSVEVIKKERRCPSEDSAFCNITEAIKRLVQDDGLIFAQGEKEDILSEHGKLYCAYDLLKRYLDRGTVLSRYHYPATPPAPDLTPASSSPHSSSPNAIQKNSDPPPPTPKIQPPSPGPPAKSKKGDEKSSEKKDGEKRKGRAVGSSSTAPKKKTGAAKK